MINLSFKVTMVICNKIHVSPSNSYLNLSHLWTKVVEQTSGV